MKRGVLQKELPLSQQWRGRGRARARKRGQRPSFAALPPMIRGEWGDPYSLDAPLAHGHDLEAELAEVQHSDRRRAGCRSGRAACPPGVTYSSLSLTQTVAVQGLLHLMWMLVVPWMSNARPRAPHAISSSSGSSPTMASARSWLVTSPGHKLVRHQDEAALAWRSSITAWIR